MKYSKSNYGYCKDSCPRDQLLFSRYYVDTGPLSRYYVDMCPLSKYCVYMCPLSRYCVNICPHSNHCADIFCWFLAVSLINYPDMYGSIYQLLSRHNNLSYIFPFTKGLYGLWQLHHSLNAIFTMVGNKLKSTRPVIVAASAIDQRP